MSADSYHHQVEKAMKELKYVYDFQGWVSALNRHGCAVNLNVQDCYKFPKGVSQGKCSADKPLLQT